MFNFLADDVANAFLESGEKTLWNVELHGPSVQPLSDAPRPLEPLTNEKRGTAKDESGGLQIGLIRPIARRTSPY